MRRLLAFLVRVFSRQQRLSALLDTLQAHGVEEYRDGDLHLKLRLRDEAPPMGAFEAIAKAQRPMREAPAGRPPTDDELLYGEEGYGLGLGGPDGVET